MPTPFPLSSTLAKTPMRPALVIVTKAPGRLAMPTFL